MAALDKVGSRTLVSIGESAALDYLDANYGGVVRRVATVSEADGSIVVNDNNGNQTWGVSALGAIALSAPQVLTGAGAVSLSSGTTMLVNAGAVALTLANGLAIGQRKLIVARTAVGTGTLTPATPNGFSTLAFTAAHQWAELEWTSASGWEVVGYNGITINA